MTKTSGDRGIFYAAVLVYLCLRRRQGVLETNEGGLKTGVIDFWHRVRVISDSYRHGE